MYGAVQSNPPAMNARPTPESLETNPHWLQSPSRLERTLPPPSPVGQGMSNMSSMSSMPPLPAMWAPERSRHNTQQSLPSTAALPRTQVVYDVKQESAGFTTPAPGLMTSGSDSDQGMEGMESNTAPTANLSAEELGRLKAKMVNLQGQVEDFRQQLKCVQEQAAAKDAQYARIIEQSTRRELQARAESRKWRADRDQWAEERRVLQDTIAALSSKLNELRGYGVAGSPDGEMPRGAPKQAPTGFSTSSTPTLEDLALAQNSPPAESRQLETLQQESSQIIEHGARLVEVGRKIQKQLDEIKERIS